MTPEQFKALKPGDVVVSKYSGIVHVVKANLGSRVTLERKRMRLWSERDDWHKIVDARSAEINRLMDKLAATMRAITRAAAEIGRTEK